MTPHAPSSLDYGLPTEDQRAEQVALLAHAFGIPSSTDTMWIDAIGHEELRVVHEGGEIWGGLGLIPMGQSFGGRVLPLMGVAGVGVRSDRLRRGVATTLMRHVLQETRERGFPLSGLYASTWSLYRRVGYECAGARYLATLTPPEIGTWAARDEGSLRLCQATVDDRPAVEALYHAQALHHPGHLQRGRYIWPRLRDLRFGIPAHGVVVHDEEGLAGYLYYRKHPPQGSFRHRVEVTDACARSPAAWRRLWGFLADLGTMVERIELPTAPHDPMYLCHPDPRFRMEQLESWLVRVTDVEGLLRGRGYGPGVAGSVDLHLHDEVLPQQAGDWRLEVEGGQGRLRRGGAGTLRLSARGLAAWATGFCSLPVLAQLGHAHGPGDAMARADAMTAGPSPWMREMF